MAKGAPIRREAIEIFLKPDKKVFMADIVWRSEAEIQEWIHRFLRPGTKRYVMGCNEHSSEVTAHFEVSAFVDDFTPNSKFNDRPIVRTTELEKDSMVLSTVSMASPISALRRLFKQGCDALDYFSFLKFSPFELKEIPYWHSAPGEEELVSSEFRTLRDRLTDSESIKTLENTVRFRACHDLSAMKAYCRRESEQYFEPFLNLGNNEVFLDVGCYDGFTSSRFADITNGEYRAIHGFEPVEANRKMIEQQCGDLANFRIWPVGLSNEPCMVRFSVEGSASRPDDIGSIDVELCRLDDLDIEAPTFIKIDIEGGERAFISGATQTLRQSRPRVAIAGYHRWDDVYVLSEMLEDILKPCSLYLRHYTEGYTETVLYVVPQGR